MLYRFARFVRALLWRILGRKPATLPDPSALFDVPAVPRPVPRPKPRGTIIRVGDRRYFRDVRGVWWRINSPESIARHELIVGRRHLHCVFDMQRVSGRLGNE